MRTGAEQSGDGVAVSTGRHDGGTVRRRRSAWPVALVVMAFLASTLAAAPAGGADGYSDVGEGGAHEAAINALAVQDVFEGTECGEGLFCPDNPIERWVMAAWLIRVLGGDVDTGRESRFADVDAAEWWSAYTEELADREITLGCQTDPLRYCPVGLVSRAQMASFIVRAFDLEPAEPAGFADTGGNTHEAAIDALAAAGITKGCETDPLRYCPDNSVSRAQMAAFLHRALVTLPLAPLDLSGASTTGGISDDVHAFDMIDVATGATVNLRSAVHGRTPLMLWLYSPY